MGTKRNYDKWIEIWRRGEGDTRVRHETIRTHDLLVGLKRAKVIAATGGVDVTIKAVLNENLDITIQDLERELYGE